MDEVLTLPKMSGSLLRHIEVSLKVSELLVFHFKVVFDGTFDKIDTYLFKNAFLSCLGDLLGFG